QHFEDVVVRVGEAEVAQLGERTLLVDAEAPLVDLLAAGADFIRQRREVVAPPTHDDNAASVIRRSAFSSSVPCITASRRTSSTADSRGLVCASFTAGA